MKLKTIEFENFRQFYGKQIVNLETTEEKNLVVIHAENNVGKTTFLKGFTWCLYKKENFKKKAYLNDYIFSQLQPNQSATTSVTLIFDDRNKEYTVKRSLEVVNVDGIQYSKEENLSVKIDGTPIETNKQDTINRILNPELSGYFFFEGENIGEMSLPENSEEIEKGIKYIMGLEIYERAILHTRNAKEYFRKRLKELESSEYGNEVSPIAKKAQIYMEIEEQKKKIKNLSETILYKEREKKDIKDQLKAAEDTERYEKEIQRLEKLLHQLKDEKASLNMEIKSHISQNAYLAISQDTLNKTNEFLESKRKKGELPSNIREQFVQDLIDQGKCICGTSLVDNIDAEQHLKDLLKHTVNKDIEDGFIKIHGFTSNHLESKNNFSTQLTRLLQERNNKQKYIDDTFALLEEEKIKRKNYSGSTSAELIRKEESIDEILKESNKLLGEYEKYLKDLEKKLQETEKELKDYHAKNNKIEIEEQRLTIAEEVLKLIETKYQYLTSEVRKELTKKVSEIFDSIIHGNYSIRINEQFELELKKIINEQEGETELSSGQEQIASLSFISALVYIAKKWDQENKHKYWGGAGIYPIVMDAPFGKLGDVYQASLTKKMKDFAPQIIVMVSSSQWTSDVEKNFGPYCQHEYVFTHHHPENLLVEQNYKDLIINNKAYPLEKVDDFEYTEIVEVEK